MVEKHPVMALPWYARADYPTLLKLFKRPRQVAGDLRRVASAR